MHGYIGINDVKKLFLDKRYAFFINSKNTKDIDELDINIRLFLSQNGVDTNIFNKTDVFNFKNNRYIVYTIRKSKKVDPNTLQKIHNSLYKLGYGYKTPKEITLAIEM